jgi:hypothetical protein
MTRGIRLTPFLVVLTFLNPAASPGTEPKGVRSDDEWFTIDPLLSKELARDRFELSRTDPRQLARARVEAARLWLRALEEEFRAGRRTVDIMNEAARSVLDAELEAVRGPSERAAALERYWEFARLVELLTAAKYRDGTVAMGDYAQARYILLGAEIRLVQAQTAEASSPGLLGGPEGPLPEGYHGDFREVPEARFEASRADPRRLSLARLQAARTMFEERLEQFRAGRRTVDVLLESSRWLLEAERAVARGAADDGAAFERHWRSALAIEEYTRGKFQRGTVGPGDYFKAKANRLEAEIGFAQARARYQRRRGPAAPAVEPSRSTSPLDKEVAKGQLEAPQADLGKLRRARVETLQQFFNAREEEVLAGRRTVDILLKAARRLLDAELAVADNPTDRVAALKRNWQFARLAVLLATAKYRAGVGGIGDLAETHYHRLTAEIELLRAAAGKAK